MHAVSFGAPAMTALALALAACGSGDAARHASGHARPALAADASGMAAVPGWRSYVESPRSRTVRPIRVLQVTGAVSNPQALVPVGPGAATTLQFRHGEPAPSIVLDYGREVGGLPSFDVTAVTGKPVLRSAFSETLAHLTAQGDATNTGLLKTADPKRYDDYLVASPGVITNRYIQGGERYQLITLTTPGSVTLRAASIHFTGVLGSAAALRGFFRSSSNQLNRIWFAGVYTLNLVQDPPSGAGQMGGSVNALSLLLDGAKRDRAVWNDLSASGLTVYYSLDPAYVKASLALLGERPSKPSGRAHAGRDVTSRGGPLPGLCSPIAHPARCFGYSATYSMNFVRALYDYYLYTGDLAFVRREAPRVALQLAWDARQVDRNGLYATNRADGRDWNVDTHVGELTYVNAVYYLTLVDAAKLSAAIGDRMLTLKYRSAARRLKQAVATQLWDAGAGVYDASTSQRGTVVQDANVYAVLSGIAPLRRARRIMAVLDRVLANRFGALSVASPPPTGYTPVVSPFIGGTQAADDFELNRTDAALALIKIEWGWMVDHDPGGTDWEKVELSGTPAALDSTAHGWATGATSALSHYVLGAAPDSPGYGSFSVIPQPGSLSWAEGRIPTPQGGIMVRWKRQRCSGFALNVDVPRRSTALLGVPTQSSISTVFLNRRTVFNRGKPATHGGAYADGGYVYVPGIGPGQVTVRATQMCPR